MLRCWEFSAVHNIFYISAHSSYTPQPSGGKGVDETSAHP